MHVLDKPLLCDYIYFRRQVFGIMTACDSYDLMWFATTNRIEKRVKGYYINGLQILENENKEWLRYDKEKRKYVCDIDKKGRRIIDLLNIGGNIENYPVVEITINSNNEISSITNPSTGMGFSIDKEYEFISTKQIEKNKIK